MAANTNPIPYFPGDGVRTPVRQAPIYSYNGNLDPKISAKLFRMRNNPRPYASQIQSTIGRTDVKPSYFSQYGRGKRLPKWRSLEINIGRPIKMF